MLKEASNKTTLKHKIIASSNVLRKFTARDITLGIGRKATEDELEEYLSRPSGKSIPLKEAIEQIKTKLKYS